MCIPRTKKYNQANHYNYHIQYKLFLNAWPKAITQSCLKFRLKYRIVTDAWLPIKKQKNKPNWALDSLNVKTLLFIHTMQSRMIPSPSTPDVD